MALWARNPSARQEMIPEGTGSGFPTLALLDRCGIVETNKPSRRRQWLLSRSKHSPCQGHRRVPPSRNHPVALTNTTSRVRSKTAQEILSDVSRQNIRLASLLGDGRVRTEITEMITRMLTFSSLAMRLLVSMSADLRKFSRLSDLRSGDLAHPPWRDTALHPTLRITD